MRLKMLIAAILTALACLGLTGCSSTRDTGAGDIVNTHQVSGTVASLSNEKAPLDYWIVDIRFQNDTTIYRCSTGMVDQCNTFTYGSQITMTVGHYNGDHPFGSIGMGPTDNVVASIDSIKG